MTRDATSGENVGLVDIDVGARKTTSNKAGIYDIDHLPPGRYDLHATYAGKDVTVKNVVVDRGLATYIDIDFKLGEPGPITIDWASSRDDAIQRFPAKAPYIEGTVADLRTRVRIAGAVVTATDGFNTLQAITDDAGHYRFDGVPPGTYAVSAYYSMGGRGQIEVRRTGIEIKADDGVRVPLEIELGK
jgi:mannose-6-phosphate isomerase-like protein (cupin superfamily)